MNTEFFAFGEMLWDCLPSGKHAGGAPFNVAAHLAQLGVTVELISTVGRDPLGDEILQVAQDKGISTRFVTRARVGLATGTVLVTLDEKNNATYELVRPVAWDEIRVRRRRSRRSPMRARWCSARWRAVRRTISISSTNSWRCRGRGNFST